jgi:hypothetical protein
MQGIINAFDMPGRQSFMVQMVEDKARPGQRHRHQLVDGERGAADRPVAGRNVDRRQQRGLVLPVDGISYIAVIASLLMMRLHSNE